MFKIYYDTYTVQGGPFLGSNTKYCSQTALISVNKSMIGHTNCKHVAKYYNYNMFCITLHATNLHICCSIHFHKFLCKNIEAKMSVSTQNEQI